MKKPVRPPLMHPAISDEAAEFIAKTLARYHEFEIACIMHGTDHRSMMNEFDDLGVGRKATDPLDVWMAFKEDEWKRRGDPVVISRSDAIKLADQAVTGELVSDYLKKPRE